MASRLIRNYNLTLSITLATASSGCGLILGLNEFEDSTTESTGTGEHDDNGLCEPGTTVICYEGPNDTANIGICKTGKKACNNDGTAYSTCEDQQIPEAEICANPADENCDSHDCVIWSQIFGDANNQTVTDIATDKDGNIFITGKFSGTLQFFKSESLVTDNQAAYIAKLAPDGVPIWAKQFDGGSISASNIAVDINGNAIVSGDFNYTISVAGQTIEASDRGRFTVYAIKWDPFGKLRWVITEDVAEEDVSVAGLAADGSNNIFIYGSDSCGTVCGLASEELWLCKYNADGQRVWCHHFAGSDSHGERLAGDIAVDSANDVLITGSFGGDDGADVADFGGRELAVGNDLDGFVVRLDDDGNYKNHQVIDGPGEQSGVGIATDKSDNVVVLANFENVAHVGIYSVPSAGMNDMLLAKFSNQLSSYWNRPLGGAYDEVAVALAVANDGTIVVTGKVQEDVDFGGGILTGVGGTDLPVIKLAPDGSHVWSKRFGDDRDQIAKSVGMLSNGEPILAGDVTGSIDTGTGNVYSMGGSDILLARFGR
ncbi:SBBP repeat-containing protein [Sorangium sp. So ce1128]